MVSPRCRVLLFDVFQDLFAGGRVQAVEQLGHRAYASVGLAAEFSQRLELLPDHRGDLVNDLRRDLIEIGHAHGYVGSQVGGQRNQQRRGLRRVQVRKDQGDGLRMLAVHELGQLLRIGLLQRVQADGFVAQGLGEAVDHSLRRFDCRKR